MAYFIFAKNLDNVDYTIYRIAANQTDLNNLNIVQSDYKIIEDSEENFNAVKLMTKQALKYNQNTITFIDLEINFARKEFLDTYISGLKPLIKGFLDNNPNHPSYGQWNSYFNQLNNLNTSTFTYPFTQSLETYFNNQGQLALNTLQIP
jgi:hypothetical protein